MLCDRAFRWQRAANGRHAISNAKYPRHVFPGDEITTLCGVTAILGRDDFELLLANGAPAPTCRPCTTKWQEYEARIKTRSTPR